MTQAAIRHMDSLGQILCTHCGLPRREGVTAEGDEHESCRTCVVCGLMIVECDCDDDKVLDTFSELGYEIGEEGYWNWLYEDPDDDAEIITINMDEAEGVQMPLNTGPANVSPMIVPAKAQPRSADEDDHNDNDDCDEHFGYGYELKGHFYYYESWGKYAVGTGSPPTNMPGWFGTDHSPVAKRIALSKQHEKSKGKDKDKDDQGWPGYMGGSSKPGTTTTYVQCEHAWHEFKVGEWSLRVTAHRDVNKTLDKIPDLGLYLDYGWKGSVIKPQSKPMDIPTITCGGGAVLDISDIKEKVEKQAKKPEEYAFPAVIVEWKDMGTIHHEVVDRMIELAVSYMQEGKVVETGCIGAHGRTGTFLAMMLERVEGLEPAEAIAEVRKRLCKKCVETKAQVHAIFGFVGKTCDDKEADKLSRY